MPRLRRQRGNAGLAQAIAEETRHWRDVIPNATVGVLFHGGRWTGLKKLASEIRSRLGDTLTDVHLAVGKGQSHYLTKTDCAVIATVRGTKGLEFDATIVIDPRRVWRKPLGEIEEVQRNAMYVSASRAKQGLSLIIDDRSALMSGGIDAKLFDLVEIQESES